MGIYRHRRKIIFVSIILAVVALIFFSYYLWCVGGALGYLGGKLGGGKKTGVHGRIKSLILPLRTYQLHLHHWFLAVVTLITCLVTGFYIVTPHLFYGSMAGLAIQGIFCYDDWFRLIKKVVPRSPPQVQLTEIGFLGKENTVDESL